MTLPGDLELSPLDLRDPKSAPLKHAANIMAVGVALELLGISSLLLSFVSFWALLLSVPLIALGTFVVVKGWRFHRLAIRQYR